MAAIEEVDLTYQRATLGTTDRLWATHDPRPARPSSPRLVRIWCEDELVFEFYTPDHDYAERIVMSLNTVAVDAQKI